MSLGYVTRKSPPQKINYVNFFFTHCGARKESKWHIMGWKPKNQDMGQPLWDAHDPLTNALTFGSYLFVDVLEKHMLASASFNQNWKIFYGGLKGSCQIWFLYSPSKRFFMSSIKILNLLIAILCQGFFFTKI